MKILVIGNLYPPVVYGGYEILCQQAVEALRRRGHDVHVLTSGFRAEEAPVSPDVTRALALATDFPRPGESVGKVDFSLRRLHGVAVHNRARTLEVLDRVRPDVVFAWCLNRLSAGPLFAARQRSVPVLYTINDEHPRQFAYERRPSGPRALARYVAQRFVWPMSTFARLSPPPVTTIISAALKRRLLEQGAPVEEAHVLLQGIPLHEIPFRPRVRAQGEPLRLMYAGQLSAVKGVHTVIEAVGMLAAAGLDALHLDVVGCGVADYEQRLRARVAELGLGHLVTFVGRLPHSEVVEAYHRHHVLVFSSEWEEPFGLVHLEAMAAGCAVISTTTGGSAELVRDGVNALAYPAGDAAALAGQIARLTGDEARRCGLLHGGREWVERHHDLERYVDRLDDLLRTTVSWALAGERKAHTEPRGRGLSVAHRAFRRRDPAHP